MGSKFKINGHSYYLSYEHKRGNKYFQCIYSRTKCHGSIVITPNRLIAKNVEHNCNKAS